MFIQLQILPDMAIMGMLDKLTNIGYNASWTKSSDYSFCIDV